ncbi:hypothetical protein CAMRE0001_2015 [Campylobacter rectus RM3267]|uniref:Uncharacterized protein n=1 Tax=Campylobacter rectus RM3267 TaxID=553218 RepID=B9D3D6_CAMRE|nr:hypothetical protein CAMRE0001_2015 [Campylobacter rectus RM3267]
MGLNFDEKTLPKKTSKLGILCSCAPWLPEISRDYMSNLLLIGSNRQENLMSEIKPKF